MDRTVNPLRQYIALDIETDGGQYDDVPNLFRDKIMSIALYCDTWFNPFTFVDVREWGVHAIYDYLHPLFADENTVIIGHNLQFDLSFLTHNSGLDYPPGDRE